ncbi:STAS domain-containing protein [Kitasatospora aureofaciens]|uniref:STAS domain-containing protein n=1 Tax=Kitasatospora aureofaciens TaxID=1894 RepID=UPI0034019EE2
MVVAGRGRRRRYGRATGPTSPRSLAPSPRWRSRECRERSAPTRWRNRPVPEPPSGRGPAPAAPRNAFPSFFRCRRRTGAGPHRPVLQWSCHGKGHREGSAAIDDTGVFTVTARDSLAGPVLTCAGELDMDQVPVFNHAAHRALAARPAPPILLLDLHEVTFIDSAGLNALLLTRIQADRQGTVVHLAKPSERVARLLEITGADQVFPVDPDVPAPRPPR